MVFNSKEEAIEVFIASLVEVGGKWTIDKSFKDALSDKPKKRVKSDDFNKIVPLTDEIMKLDMPSFKVGGSVYFKCNHTDLENKLSTFFGKYNYDTDIVLQAVKAYIKDVEESPSYKKALKYFIYKEGEGSLLADYCDKMLNGEINQESKNDRFISI